MKADPFPIGTVLNGVKRFVVPIYQRAYSWTVSEELEPLWENLVTKAEERMASRRSAFPHYMGALIVIPEGEFSFGQIQTYNVVDGQQRLTTFQIALAAFSSLADELRSSAEAEAAAKGEATMSPYGRSAANIATHLRAQFDREVFRSLIDLDLEKLREKFPAHFFQNGNLRVSSAPLPLRAWWYFRTEALEFMSRAGDRNADRVKHLEALSASLLEDYRVIVITLDANDDAQVIFETLNSRGKPLAAMDLVRNDIFHRAAKRNEDVDQLMTRQWSVFEDQFWKDTQRQGRLKKQRMDFFLAHTLSAERGTEVVMTELYAEYRKFVKDRPFESVSAELAMLTRYAPTYRELVAPSGDSSLSKLAKRLAAFEVSTAFPAVFVVATSDVAAEEKAKLYEVISGFAIRRAICGLSTNNYTRIFNRLAGSLRERGLTVANAIAFLSEQTADTFRFPTDAEVAQAIRERKQYGDLNAGRLRHILEELELASRDRFDEATRLPDDLTIEHVLPDEWLTERWSACSSRP